MALGYCCQDAIFLSDGGHDLCILYLQERQEEKKMPLHATVLLSEPYIGTCPQIRQSLNAKHRIKPSIPAAVPQFIRELRPIPFLSYS